MHGMKKSKNNTVINMGENDYDARDLLEPLYEEAAQVKQRVLFPLDQAKEVIDQIIEICDSEGKRFYDFFFPPSKRSYSHYPPSYLKDDKKEFGTDYTWKRFSDIHIDPGVFIKKIQPGDIDQGTIGNCYMIAEISSFAQRPDLVKEAIYPNEWNSAGIFGVKIWIETMQEWRMVILDDFFPVDMNDYFFFACSKTKNEAWSSLLEKAIAKINGCYLSLEFGNKVEVVPALTGQSIALLLSESPEDVFEAIRYYSSNGGLVQCSGGTILKDGTYTVAKREEGLVQGHAYSVLDAVEMDGFRLIKLRNAWGHFEWNGDWSDDSDLWNQYPEIAEACKHKISENGIFWMSLEDFSGKMGTIKVTAIGFDHLPDTETVSSVWGLDTNYFEFKEDLQEVTDICFRQIDEPDSDEKIFESLPQYKLELNERTEFIGIVDKSYSTFAYIFPNTSGQRIYDLSLITDTEYAVSVNWVFSAFELDAGVYTVVFFTRDEAGIETVLHLWTKEKLDLAEI